MKTPRTGWILWIEDDDQIVNDLLLVWHFPVPIRRVSGTADAVEVLKTARPKLILLDLHLPHFLAPTNDEEGLALLRRIRSRVSEPPPVVVLTQDASADFRSRALALGADAYLCKPVPVGELEGVVLSLLNRRE